MPDVVHDVDEGTVIARLVGLDVDDVPFATLKTAMGFGSAADHPATDFATPASVTSAIATAEAYTDTQIAGVNQYSDEKAEDAVGGILTDTATVDFTYNDAANQITADIKANSIDNTFIADMAQSTIKGRAAAAGTGDPTDLTAAQVKTLLALSSTDNPQFNTIELGAATDTTISRTGAGDIAVEGNGIYRAGGTDVPVLDGGTGASTAANARTNLGLVIGTDVEAHDSDLTTIAGLTPSNDDFIQRKSGLWTNRSVAQVLADLAVPGTTFQPLDATLTALAGITVAQGDVILATGADAFTNLNLGSAAGKTNVADPNAANKVSVQYPTALDDATRGTTSSLASTYDRAIFTETNQAGLATGRLSMFRIFLPKGLSVTTISFWSMTTPLSVGTNQWFALFNLSRLKLAITADDTSTAWAANTKKTLTITGGPFVTTAAGWYYLGIMVKATTPPSLVSSTATVGASAQIAAPIPAGTADTGLTNPASCPSTAAAITANSTVVYAEVA